MIAFLLSPYSRDIFRTPSVQVMEGKFNAVGASTEHTSAVANPKKDANDQKTPEADEKRRGTPYREKSAPAPRDDVSCFFSLAFVATTMMRVWHNMAWLGMACISLHSRKWAS